MTVPSLPPEVWFRISTFLCPPELCAMSQVNQTFHKIATDKIHFQRLLPIPQSSFTNPSIAYRRLRALSYPPSRAALQLSPHTHILCILEHSLILLDTITARLISFPDARTANVHDLVGTSARWPQGYVQLHLLRKHMAILPGARIAFLKGYEPTILTVLDVAKWEMTKHVIFAARRLDKAVLRSSPVSVAGKNGEWIMYHVSEETVVLVDWRMGSVVGRVTNIPDPVDWKWLMGTCPATNDRSVVGVVRVITDASECKVHVKGFDGVEMTFQRDENRLVFVLRSADAKTHVLINHGHKIPGMLIDLPEVFVYRKLSNSIQTWSEYLIPPVSSRILMNGNVIESRPSFRMGTSLIPQYQFLVLTEDGRSERIWCPRYDRFDISSQMLWFKRTLEGGLAVVASESKNILQLVELQRGDSSDQLCYWIFGKYDREKDPLHSWSVEGLIDLCVLDDHVIVATRTGGNLESFHFDRFCRDWGIHGCPWKKALENFLFP